MRVQRKTTARGYGNAHQQMRKRINAQVQRGLVCCTRCGRWIAPGTPWDLDHSDDRNGYRGASHATCNRSAGGRIGGRAKRKAALPPNPSPVWRADWY
jgi:hypothetical protein